MQELNILVFQFFNNMSSIGIIAKISPILADFPIFFLPVFLLSTWIYYSIKERSREEKHTILFIFYSCVIAIVFSLIIQQFIHLDRPETAITSSGKLLLAHIPDASFPSDHASVAVAFLSALFFGMYKKTFWAFLPWVIMMLLARIIVGVHWPFDIIVGSFIGAISGYISVVQLSQLKFVKKLNSFIIQTLSYIKL